jgi:hypothetical protein
MGGASDSGARLAKSLKEATATFMRPDSVAREVFGDAFVDHFGGTREHEVRLWEEAVTDWFVLTPFPWLGTLLTYMLAGRCGGISRRFNRTSMEVTIVYCVNSGNSCSVFRHMCITCSCTSPPRNKSGIGVSLRRPVADKPRLRVCLAHGRVRRLRESPCLTLRRGCHHTWPQRLPSHSIKPHGRP